MQPVISAGNFFQTGITFHRNETQPLVHAGIRRRFNFAFYSNVIAFASQSQLSDPDNKISQSHPPFMPHAPRPGKSQVCFFILHLETILTFNSYSEFLLLRSPNLRRRLGSFNSFLFLFLRPSNSCFQFLRFVCACAVA